MMARQFFGWPTTGWRTTFDEIERFRQRLDRLADAGGPGMAASAGVFPAVNLTETKDAFILRAELPGVKPAGLEISITGRALSISGERKAADREGAGCHRQERRWGRFSRVLTLPADVENAKVDAASKNGVLTVTLPKSEAARPRQIKVSG